MRSRLLLAGLTSAALLVPAMARAAEPFDYADLDTVLSRHVRGDIVDYGALARAREPLDRFLERTRQARPESWPRAAQIAFWVNAYNARVLEAVLEHPGLGSVLDVGKILGIPTLRFFRTKRLTAGRMMSLDDIEHGILRQSFDEPRIHFVVNCASVSCPRLPTRALRAETLDRDLEAATRAFLADPSRNRFPPAGPILISKIFDWYEGDFASAAGSLQAFVMAHWPEGDPPALGHRPIRHLDYDWSLNGHW